MYKVILSLCAGVFTASFAQAGLVYLDDTNGDLFVGDPTTATYDYVGTSTRASIFDGFTDIAFASTGILYGLDPSGNLYQINPANGHVVNEGGTNNSIGSTGITNGTLVGLAGNSTGLLYAGGADTLYSINPSVSTSATAVGSNTGTSYTVAGDLEFVGKGL